MQAQFIAFTRPYDFVISNVKTSSHSLAILSGLSHSQHVLKPNLRLPHSIAYQKTTVPNPEAHPISQTDLFWVMEYIGPAALTSSNSHLPACSTKLDLGLLKKRV